MKNAETVKRLVLSENLIAYFLSKIIKDREKVLVLIPEEFNELALELKTFNKSHKVFTLLKDTGPKERQKLARSLKEGKKSVILASIEGLAEGIPDPEDIKKNTINIEVNTTVRRDRLIEVLTEMGYTREEEVYTAGTFSVRGFVIDLFPVNLAEPLRIELDGDLVESIRIFNPDTQRSRENLEKVTIEPAKTKNKIKIDTINFDEIIKVMPDAITEEAETLKFFSGLKLNIPETIVIDTILKDDEETKIAAVDPFDEAKTKEERIKLIKTKIKNLVINKNYRVLIVAEDEDQAKGVKEILEDIGIKIEEWHKEEIPPPKAGFYMINGYISHDFLYDEEKLVVVKATNLVAKRKKIHKAKKANHIIIDIEPGDFVVHREYGIGRFIGIKNEKIEGIDGEFAVIEYADGNILVPVERLNVVEKYISKDGYVPSLDKISSSNWEKRRRKVEKALKEIAEKLLITEAKRKTLKGHSYSPDTQWQREFEEAFPFEETEDQLKAIEEVKKDMESSTPMDRIICGDVGFGKTEIAMRAAFKAVMDGKQVAVLTPTTLLAHQHFETFKERFSKFPIVIEVLTRFVPREKQKKIIEDTRNGRVDILIGTHRIIMEDVTFKDIGLLIIDEEHRFGVEHKEKLKEKYPTIDVLTLTATPIPRTLNMALTGLRDISIIQTPPKGKRDTKTFVMFYNEDIIKRAIKREIERGGKVFVVKSRIKNIEKLKEKIEKLVPEAKVEVVHGKLKSEKIEETMLNFVTDKINVLVATHIIESGLDIQKANTLIVVDSENFGLAQLYQLRGRVGRGTETAYAYFMVTPGKITEYVKRRLKALEEFSKIGSGLKLALRDMEIRGFGNLLGKEQAGYIKSIGLEEYLKLLEETIKKIKGEYKEEIEPVIKLNIKAYIPNNYIEDERLRLRIYRLLTKLSLNEIEEIEADLRDRFGKIPEETVNLLNIIRIRELSKKIGITKISQEGKKFFFETQNKTVEEKLLRSGFKKLREKIAYFEAKNLQEIVNVLLELLNESNRS